MPRRKKKAEEQPTVELQVWDSRRKKPGASRTFTTEEIEQIVPFQNYSRYGKIVGDLPMHSAVILKGGERVRLCLSTEEVHVKMKEAGGRLRASKQI